MILLVLVVIVGCKKGSKGAGGGDVNYREGTNGLTLNFPVGTITQAYENDPEVKMIVEIKDSVMSAFLIKMALIEVCFKGIKRSILGRDGE